MPRTANTRPPETPQSDVSPTFSNTSASMEQAIQACLECQGICLETSLLYCLEVGGKHAEPTHIRLMLDCAEICQTSANFMRRNAELHGAVCAVCEQVCERCAEECDAFTDDEKMHRCAEICRTCAAACHNMATTFLSTMPI